MKKFLFIVQGEGRGHLTQAIAMSQIIENAGHEVVAVMLGCNHTFSAPDFFKTQINKEIEYFNSPSLECNKKGKIDFIKSVVVAFKRIKLYFQSLKQINNTIEKYQPDAIINFYDVLGGLHKLVYRSKVPMACIGHHYLFLHSEFQFPEKQFLNRLLLKLNTKLTAFGAEKRLALSFRSMPDEPENKICVVPPLIRKEIRYLKPEQKTFWLVYVNYTHLANQVLDWHYKNPSIKLYCFWNHDFPEAEHVFDESLTIHKIDGVKFLSKMAECEALVTTSGFESVCEAMYLGKPALMVPAHYEQACNGLDATLSGAGITAESFELGKLLDYLPQHQSVQEKFKSWYLRSDYLMVRHLEELTSIPKHKRNRLRGLDIFRNQQKRFPIPG